MWGVQVITAFVVEELDANVVLGKPLVCYKEVRIVSKEGICCYFSLYYFLLVFGSDFIWFFF